MRRFFLLLLIAGELIAQNTAKFPGRAATNADMGVASNRAATTLTSGINSSATSIPVLSSSGFKAGSFVTIDNEQIAVCSIPDGSHLNAGVSACPNVDGRGVDTANGAGAAASHLVNAAVQGRIVAWHVNQPAAEIVAVENSLEGPRAFGAKGDGSTDDTAAFTSAVGGSQQLVRVPLGTYTTTGFTISANNVTLECAAGAVIQARASTSTVVTITGSGDTIKNCVFDGANNGATSNFLVYANGATNFAFINNTIKNTVGGQYGLRGINLVDGLIEGNICTSVGSGCVSADDGSTRVRIIANTADSSGMTNGSNSGSLFQAKSSANGNIVDITFASNTCKLGGAGFCIEAGNFGGSGTVSSVTLVGNVATNYNSNSSGCTSASTPKSCGGYSFSTISASTMSGNTYNANGHSTDIAGIEMTVCTECSAISNILNGGTFAIAGMSLACFKCIVTGNQLIGWTGAANGAIYYDPTNSFLDNSASVITGNFVTVTASTDTGININCNRASGAISRLVVTGNTIVGLGSTVGTGITLAQNNGTCTLDSNVVGQNTFTNLNKGYIFGVNTNTSWTDSTYTSTTTKFQDNGGNTFLPNHVPNSLRVGSLTDPSTTLDVTGTGQFSGSVQMKAGAFVSSNPLVVNQTSYSGIDNFRVDNGGTASFSGTMCMTTAKDCSTVPNGDSPIFELFSGNGASDARWRITSSYASNVVFANSVDGTPQGFGSGGTTWLTLNGSGVGPRSVTASTFPSPTNGFFVWCSDCTNTHDDSHTAGAVCAGSGHGALAIRENGAWNCY